AGKVGVEWWQKAEKVRQQTRLVQTASRQVANRYLLDIGGIWIDEGFNSKQETVSLKAMSAAYFRMLERHPQVRDVFRLGNHIVWVTPSNTVLIVALNEGREEMTDAEIDRLFQPPPAKTK